MSPYSFSSPHRGAAIHVLTIGIFSAAIILFSIAGYPGVPYPVIYQVAAFTLCTAGIYFMVRYVLKQYRYEVSESSVVDASGLPIYDLVITEMVGKKVTVVARVALRDMTDVTVLARSDDEFKTKRNALCQGARVFKYENTPLSHAGCYISIPTEQSVLLIPPDKKMIAILKGHMT